MGQTVNRILHFTMHSVEKSNTVALLTATKHRHSFPRINDGSSGGNRGRIDIVTNDAPRSIVVIALQELDDNFVGPQSHYPPLVNLRWTHSRSDSTLRTYARPMPRHHDTVVTMDEQPDVNRICTDIDGTVSAKPLSTTDDLNIRPNKHDIPCPSTNRNVDVEVIELDDLSFMLAPLI